MIDVMYTCTLGTETWSAHAIVRMWEGFAEVIFTGHGSRYNAIVGSASLGNFITIPMMHIGEGLARWDDTWWNRDRLVQPGIMEVDAVTIAEGLAEMNRRRLLDFK